jgi:photosystem II stability/assembly factor-like uncharacterized protein
MFQSPNRHLLYTRFLACALFLLSPLAAQDSPWWRIIGPGGGGAMFHPAISPLDPARVLVGCDMTGSYLTNDGGRSWRMFNLRAPARFFAFDPSDRRTMYAYSAGLWQSTDSGRTWSLRYPNPGQVKGLDMSGDHGDVEVLAEPPAQSLSAIAIDPSDSQRLYVASAELLTSADRGHTWQSIHELKGKALGIWIDPRSPAGDRTVVIVTEQETAVRTRGQWTAHPAPEKWIDAGGGFVVPSHHPVLYAVTRTALRVSTDSGATWKPAALPGVTAQYRAVAASAGHGETAYVSYEGKVFGVARTRDSGATWELVWKDTREAAGPNVKDAWINERFGPAWGEAPLTLGVSPVNPQICYATDLGRTMRTLNGGKTWEAVYSRPVSDHAYTSTGLNVTTTYGVHFDPFNRRRMFIDYTDIGLFRSEDSGRSWISSSTGIPHRWLNTTYWTVFDPSVRGRAWAAVSGTHDLPRPKMWRHRSPSLYRGGVVISDDGGATWRPSNSGMPETAVTHILLDPQSPPSARILYAAAFGRGVYKSVDGGASWTLKNEGIAEPEPFAWRLVLDQTRTLYLVVARRSEQGEIGDAGDGDLYRSRDGAQHWEKVPLPAGVNGPVGLAVDSRDPARLYLASWRRAIHAPEAGGGIWLSTNGGAAWRPVLQKDQHVYDVTQDPRAPDVLYAAGFESSAWRSADRGEHWVRIRGFNFKWAHRVIPDPNDPRKIYITTFGGSVWHGPAAGDPASREDIATPALAYSEK